MGGFEVLNLGFEKKFCFVAWFSLNQVYGSSFDWSFLLQCCRSSST